MRCPACGATNSDRAEWCTQCFRDLRGPGSPTVGAPVPPAEPAPTDLEPTAPGPHAPSDGAGDRAAPSAPDGARRDVRTVDGEVEWRCARCEAWSPLASAACTTCGAAREGFGEAPRPPELDPSDRGRLVGASLVFPGLGHLLARRTGTGLARSLLVVTWLVGAWLVTGDGGSALAAAPLLLGVAIVWAGSIRDVAALVDGGREVLTSRVLLWLTGAVILTLLGTLVVTTGGAGTG